MSKFNNKSNDGSKTKFNKNNRKPVKPKYTKIKVSIADSDFYASGLDSLYNLLCSISFDKVSVPVYMLKSELFDNSQLKGTAVFGSIDKFNNDNTFTVSVQESLASKFTDGHVMSIRCKKDYESGEITYISSFCIVKGKSVQNNYDDVEKAMLDKAEEETEAATEEVEVTE
jgi:hypothetical protein